MTKGEVAKQYFLAGNNCSTAVVLSFKEEIGLDEKTLKKISICFGGGFGRQRLTCGAVSGLGLVLGTLLSDGENKLFIYDVIQKACAEVKKELGSIVCGELLANKVNVTTTPNPDERNDEYYKKRPCAEICELCANIADKYLKEYKNRK